MAEMNLQDAVKKFAGDLAKKVSSYVEDISVLEVRTYTTPADQAEILLQGAVDFTQISTEGKIALRAYTKVNFDGDTTVVAPTDAVGEVNRSVWELHEATVQQAMTNRNEMIKSIGEAASSALKALGLASGE